MTTHLLRAGTDDHSEVLEYLERDHLVNTFAIADIVHYGWESAFQEVYLQREESVIGVFVKYRDTLIIAGSPGSLDGAAVTDLIIRMRVSRVMGLAANLKRVDEFLPSHSEPNYFRTRLLYQPQPTSVPKVIPGLRFAQQADAARIHAFLQSDATTKALYPDPVMIVNRLRIGEGVHLLVERRGEIVAHANTAASTKRSAMIGGLLVAPDFRCRGMATGLVAYLSDCLHKGGQTPCLMSNHPTESSLFANEGFLPLADWAMIDLKCSLR